MTHGIDRHPITFIVFAGNYREFRTWQLASGVRTEHALFVANPTNLSSLKLDGDYHLIFVGTFHLRKDKDEIMAAAHEKFPNTRFTTVDFTEPTF